MLMCHPQRSSPRERKGRYVGGVDSNEERKRIFGFRELTIEKELS